MSSPSSAEPQRNESDPTLVRNQPALRTSNGNLWLIVGAAIALLGVLGCMMLARAAIIAAPPMT